ncbi:MAG: energy transducer TonB [Burkholderiales bacterium]
MNNAALANMAVAHYSLASDKALPLWRRGAALTAVIGLHVFGLLAVLGLASQREMDKPLQALSVRMIETAPKPHRTEAPKPKRPTPAPPRKALAAPPPVMTAAPSAASSPGFVLAPQPEPHPAESPRMPSAAPTPLPVSAARFDADYLHNPQPVYPLMSRRAGEEGKVVLRVRVSAQGLPLSVEVKQSSGYSRLDEAARAAIEKWRFIPARQGKDAIEASVLVPLHFTLVN